jgi:hypothetical protein
VKHQPQQLRAGQLHRESAQQVVGIQIADILGADDHAGEYRDHSRADHRVPANDIRGDAQILQFGIGDLAVDLRQRFESAHGEQ